jgi:hypothetical protein
MPGGYLSVESAGLYCRRLVSDRDCVPSKDLAGKSRAAETNFLR